VDQVIERFAQLGYLDDDAFARAWVDSRDRARPRGENALRRELALKGVARETVDLVLADRAGSTAPHTATNMDPDAQLAGGADHAAARRLVDRRRAAIAREPDPRRRRQKVYALLARNGFDPEVCRDVSAALSEEA
jgi:regulatory protein